MMPKVIADFKLKAGENHIYKATSDIHIRIIEVAKRGRKPKGTTDGATKV